jgi:hypothetical protein
VTIVFTFYTKNPAAEVPSRPSRSKRDSSFRGLRVSFYDAPQGYPGGSSLYPTEPALSHLSTTQPPPSWLESGPTEDGTQRRSDGEAEHGVTTSTSEERDLPNPESISPDPGQSTRRKAPVPSPLNVDAPVTYPLEGENLVESSSSLTHQLPLGTPYDIGQSSSIPATAALVTSPDSPTLGPGIRTVREGGNPSSTTRSQSPSHGSLATSQTSGFENLLREQNELERSIIALQTLLAPGQGGERRDESSDASSNFAERSRARESSGTTGNGLKSASNKSEFSLSVFPEPPRMRQATQDFSTYSRQSLLPSAPIPSPRMSFDIEEQRFPSSTRESDVSEFRRPESAGTRYDVTSFIGGAL